jgi:hypothetical protein
MTWPGLSNWSRKLAQTFYARLLTKPAGPDKPDKITSSPDLERKFDATDRLTQTR